MYSFLRGVNICKVKLAFPVLIIKVSGKGKPVQKKKKILLFFLPWYLLGKWRKKKQSNRTGKEGSQKCLFILRQRLQA